MIFNQDFVFKVNLYRTLLRWKLLFYMVNPTEAPVNP